MRVAKHCGRCSIPAILSDVAAHFSFPFTYKKREKRLLTRLSLLLYKARENGRDYTRFFPTHLSLCCCYGEFVL